MFLWSWTNTKNKIFITSVQERVGNCFSSASWMSLHVLKAKEQRPFPTNLCRCCRFPRRCFHCRPNIVLVWLSCWGHCISLTLSCLLETRSEMQVCNGVTWQGIQCSVTTISTLGLRTDADAVDNRVIAQMTSWWKVCQFGQIVWVRQVAVQFWKKTPDLPSALTCWIFLERRSRGPLKPWDLPVHTGAAMNVGKRQAWHSASLKARMFPGSQLTWSTARVTNTKTTENIWPILLSIAHLHVVYVQYLSNKLQFKWLWRIIFCPHRHLQHVFIFFLFWDTRVSASFFQSLICAVCSFAAEIEAKFCIVSFYLNLHKIQFPGGCPGGAGTHVVPTWAQALHLSSVSRLSSACWTWLPDWMSLQTSSTAIKERKREPHHFVSPLR